jgi:hypothetical protein
MVGSVGARRGYIFSRRNEFYGHSLALGRTLAVLRDCRSRVRVCEAEAGRS